MMSLVTTKPPGLQKRPPSSFECAKKYDTCRRLSMTENMIRTDVTPFGVLVDFKKELEDFEERLHEPTVGTILDTSGATDGQLYRLRDHLKCA